MDQQHRPTIQTNNMDQQHRPTTWTQSVLYVGRQNTGLHPQEHYNIRGNYGKNVQSQLTYKVLDGHTLGHIY